MKAVLKVIMGLVVLIVIGWLTIPMDWRMRYAILYDVRLDKVAVRPRPHDCDWLAAPLGNKHCHYSPQILKMTADGKLIDPPIAPQEKPLTLQEEKEVNIVHGLRPDSVLVDWTKIED